MRLYLAGGMTGYKDYNFPAFHENAARLRAAGYSVFNPAETGIVEGWEWADYLRYDLPFVARAEGIALLSGWQASRGARAEVRVANDLGIPTRLVIGWLDQAEVSAPVEVCEKRAPRGPFGSFLSEGEYRTAKYGADYVNHYAAVLSLPPVLLWEQLEQRGRRGPQSAP